MPGYGEGVYGTELYGDLSGVPFPPPVEQGRGTATVWAQALDGQWERVGPDRVRGVWPEGLRATANDWGPDTCSFLVRRDPGAVFPDLLPFTPIDVEVAGERDWSGFVWEPPQQADERAIQVECRGWQYHADDDLLDRLYVHSRLESWRDQRSFLGANLAAFNAAGLVEAGDGVVVLGQADGTTWGNDEGQGVTLDLGAASAKRVSVEWDEINLAGNAAFDVFVRGHDSPDPLASGFEDAITRLNGSISDGTVSGTFATPRRYVSIMLFWQGAGGVTGNDHLLRVTAVRVYAATAYESGNASILKASTVVADLLPFCPLLDQRTDLIVASSVSLPDFELSEQTPRQGMEQANAVEGYQLRVTPERMLEYRPRPTVPLFKTGSWAPDALSGASRGSGEPIHNRVLVKGNDSSGGAVVVERFAGQQAGVVVEQVDSPAADNPTFATDVTSWTEVGAGTLTRDTGVFDTSPASGKWGVPAIGNTLTETFTGTFERGQLYLLAFKWRANDNVYVDVAFGHLSSGDYVGSIPLTPLGIFEQVLIPWVPKADRTGVQLRLTTREAGGVTDYYIDSLALARAAPTLPDRRGFVRTRGIRVSRAITTALGTDMADASLREAMRTPFKGDLTVYPGTVRSFQGDAPVHPASLLRHTGELLHDSHLIDPDNGNLGRDARIATVAYDDEAGVAHAALDNTRSDFETQLAKYEVVGR